MTGKTRIFICYKKKDKDGNENDSAQRLFGFLNDEAGYEVWMDDTMKPGVEWERSIYENLISSDALILVIGHGSSASDWVRREISIALAFDVRIIPVGIGIDEKQLGEEMRALGLSSFHYVRPFTMTSGTSRAIVRELEPAIAGAKKDTRASGRRLIGRINDRIKEPESPKAGSKMSASEVEISVGGNSFRLHVAAGDIFYQENVFDVLVNSENNWMQMSRFFDRPGLSSNIRQRGSSKEKNGLRDTIQAELDFKLKEQARPVLPATAIITSSGAKTSNLYHVNRATHVIHVASVEAVWGAVGVMPLKKDDQIRDCVWSALSAAQDLCSMRGVVSPPGTSQREFQESMADRFAPKSIVLPLFGTGNGGETTAFVAPIVLRSIRSFLSSHLFLPEWFSYSDIHVGAFSEADVAIVAAELAALGLPD